MKKKKAKSTTKKFRLKRTQNIGSPDAETDNNLFDVFINTSNLEEILDVENQKSILIGRTGSGKSAILRYLQENCSHLTVIEPEGMSLRFLSNSTVLRYFKSLDVNLVLFYKVLWKHVFVVELLKLYFPEKEGFSGGKLVQLLENIRAKAKKKNPRRDRALSYLDTWSKDFWLNTEYRVRSLEQTVVDQFAVNLGLSVADVTAGISSGKENFTKQSFEAKQKAEKVIHDSQSEEILEIIAIMREDFFVNSQRKYYILIDDLDKEWIEDSFRYELIGAMIEVIKEFRKLTGVKIVISLRENLNEIVFAGIQNKGGQREKFKPLYSHLRWTNDDLVELVNKRLKNLSDNQMSIKQAFSRARRNKKSGLDYVLERTYSRPRDVISFFNHIIENAHEKYQVNFDIISKAEAAYSLDRFQALEDEWSENYGQLGGICTFLRGVHNGFQLKSVPETRFEDVYVDEENEFNLRGDMLTASQKWRSGKINYLAFLKKTIFVLYRIGVLGVKKGPGFTTAYYYSTDQLIERTDITHNCRFYVHPALYSYLKVNTLEQLPESSNNQSDSS